MTKVTFLNPEFFWLFLVLPMAFTWDFFKKKNVKPTVKDSYIKSFMGYKVNGQFKAAIGPKSWYIGASSIKL